MLYNNDKSLSMDLFKNPTSEYRAAPFWAWNCDLDKDELLRQIEVLKQMGFGGFYIHTRSGMSTKYLSDEFMSLVKVCTNKAKDEKMLSYLYDEDRWPSGAAGGYVTKNYPEFRQRRLVFTEHKRECSTKEEAIKNGETYFLGMYDIVLNQNGELEKYSLTDDENKACGIIRYAYIEVYSSFNKSPGWYNGGTYVDTLSKKAMEKFVEITHERYKEAVGAEFGKTVKTIFTDEPQFSHYRNLSAPDSRNDAYLPWTLDIEESFFNAFGYDIKEKLPELFWERADKKVSVVRYNFSDHICERFVQSCADTIGDWCEKNNIYLTGHLYGEYTLASQAKAVGEAMRSYRSYQLPGIDMLNNNTEYSTVKQAQSAVHQYGREGGMSECYGVTNWDFDFRGHKFQGDWQAAMGITMRVPHLAWVSMKGAAKRDYPASINYQSPWYQEYSFIENHFARLNTVLTRGKPIVDVGVIHPIESYWLHYGPESVTSSLRNNIDLKFDNIVNWLLFETIDFDFVCESSLPQIGSVSNGKFNVGKMSYSTILVPSCETLRSTTVKLLDEFVKQGGRVIFAGDVPKYVDAVENNAINTLYGKCEKIPYDRFSIANALREERVIEITDANAKKTDSFICQLRHDTDADYLFVAHAKPYHDLKRNCGTEPPTSTRIKIRGEYYATVLDTITGKEENAEFVSQNGYTTVNYDFYENDSLLLKLVPCKNCFNKSKKIQKTQLGEIDFKNNVTYRRHENNVCLFDLAEYSLNGGEFCPTEQILRIDKSLREKFSWPQASGQDMQPWAIEKDKTSNYVTLRFTFNSEESFSNTYFCAEELSQLTLNGENIILKQDGYFVDKSIKKFALPTLLQGENVILAKIPFAKEESLEACYLTGDFNVVLSGCEKTLVKAKTTIGFGDIVSQGMPFYGGNVSYIQKINLEKNCDLCINVAKYKGALAKVLVDGKDAGNVVFAPYDLYIENVEKGEHTLEFVLYGNRHNTFGGLHNCGISTYYGQGYWYSTGNSWSYEYNLKPAGILKSPVITMYENISQY